MDNNYCYYPNYSHYSCFRSLTVLVSLCVRQSAGDDILASLRELEDTLRDSSPAERAEGPKPSGPLHQECLYYLNTYGTHLALISFYMRHDRMTDALTYLLNKARPASCVLFRLCARCSSHSHVDTAIRNVLLSVFAKANIETKSMAVPDV